jgi:hypothetical protein
MFMIGAVVRELERSPPASNRTHLPPAVGRRDETTVFPSGEAAGWSSVPTKSVRR